MLKSGYKVEILKDGKWIVAGSSRTFEGAEKFALQTLKACKATEHRITKY